MVGRALLLLVIVVGVTIGVAFGLNALGLARHWSAWGAGLAGAATAWVGGHFPPRDRQESSHGG